MPLFGCQPDNVTLAAMIDAFGRSGNVEMALSLYDRARTEKWRIDPGAFSTLIRIYGVSGNYDGCLNIYEAKRPWQAKTTMGTTPYDRFCGCLLNVMTQTPIEEIDKLIGCVEKAKPKLGHVVKMLVQEQNCEEGVFKREVSELIDSIGSDVKKAYLNCLIDHCVNLNKLERACEILQLGLEYDIYSGLESKYATQWSLHLKSLSLGATLIALHVWMNDLSVESGEEFPLLLGINTGHGKHKYSDKGLAAVFESQLKELNAPFHEAPHKVGWLLTSSVAAKALLESRRSSGGVSVWLYSLFNILNPDTRIFWIRKGYVMIANSSNTHLKQFKELIESHSPLVHGLLLFISHILLLTLMIGGGDLNLPPEETCSI